MSDPTVRLRFVPQPRQLAYVTSPADITVFGGARGGGKTHGSLGDFWLHSEVYGIDARGLMVRKTREDLKDTIDRGISMYADAAEWKEHGKCFQFRNGAKLYMAYLENEQDAEHYQGWSLTRIYIEELTQFSSLKPMKRLLGALRSSAGVRCQMKCTCNPGGPGHHAVKSEFIDLGPFNIVRDADTGLTRLFIPSRVEDNPALLTNDPGYVGRLKATGSPELVRAWLDGDWDVIEGSFFPEFDRRRHVIVPFPVPNDWIKFRSMDWGSAKPFSIGWWCVVQDDFEHDGRLIPRGAIVRYREWYGMLPGQQNVGVKMPAEEVAAGIVSRETDERRHREYVAYGVLDPAAFAVISGPTIAETLVRHGCSFRRADNTRKSRDKKMGGWDQLRARLKGDKEGRPLIYFADHCHAIIRTLPALQHDPHNAEDVDTDNEDHAPDETRYACMSRPYRQSHEAMRDRNPFRISNVFKLHELEGR
jgi:Terminase large subunit, T4likevirus-type, N-terminal